MAEQLTAEQDAASPVAVQVAGQAVLLVPHRGPGVDGTRCRRTTSGSSQSCGARAGRWRSSRSARSWGLRWRCGAKLEPLRGKLSKLAGRGWLRKLPDGKFTTRL